MTITHLQATSSHPESHKQLLLQQQPLKALPDIKSKPAPSNLKPAPSAALDPNPEWPHKRPWLAIALDNLLDSAVDVGRHWARSAGPLPCGRKAMESLAKLGEFSCVQLRDDNTMAWAKQYSVYPND